MGDLKKEKPEIKTYQKKDKESVCIASRNGIKTLVTAGVAAADVVKKLDHADRIIAANTKELDEKKKAVKA